MVFYLREQESQWSPTAPEAWSAGIPGRRGGPSRPLASLQCFVQCGPLTGPQPEVTRKAPALAADPALPLCLLKSFLFFIVASMSLGSLKSRKE